MSDDNVRRLYEIMDEVPSMSAGGIIDFEIEYLIQE